MSSEPCGCNKLQRDRLRETECVAMIDQSTENAGALMKLSIVSVIVSFSSSAQISVALKLSIRQIESIMITIISSTMSTLSHLWQISSKCGDAPCLSSATGALQTYLPVKTIFLFFYSMLDLFICNDYTVAFLTFPSFPLSVTLRILQLQLAPKASASLSP